MGTPVSVSDEIRGVLVQLFEFGPTHDANIVSRKGRDDLNKLGMLERSMGWNTLNALGVQLVVELRIHLEKRRRSESAALLVSA